MIDSILIEIGNLKWVIVIYSAIIILMCGLFWFFTRKFNFVKRKTTLFAFLYNLDYWQVFALGLIFGRIVFTLCFAIFCETINLGHLIVLILFSVGMCVITKNYNSIVSELINSLAVFAILFIESALYGYYVSVEHLFIVFVMCMLLGLFAFLYMILQSLSSYERFITKEDVKKKIKKNKETKKALKLKVKND